MAEALAAMGIAAVVGHTYIPMLAVAHMMPFAIQEIQRNSLRKYRQVCINTINCILECLMVAFSVAVKI